MRSTRLIALLPLALMLSACQPPGSHGGPPQPPTGILAAMPDPACIDRTLRAVSGVSEVTHQADSEGVFDIFPHFGPSRTRHYFWTYRLGGHIGILKLERDHYGIRYWSGPPILPSESGPPENPAAALEARLAAECGLLPSLGDGGARRAP